MINSYPVNGAEVNNDYLLFTAGTFSLAFDSSAAASNQAMAAGQSDLALVSSCSAYKLAQTNADAVMAIESSMAATRWLGVSASAVMVFKSSLSTYSRKQLKASGRSFFSFHSRVKTIKYRYVHASGSAVMEFEASMSVGKPPLRFDQPAVDIFTVRADLAEFIVPYDPNHNFK